MIMRYLFSGLLVLLVACAPLNPNWPTSSPRFAQVDCANDEYLGSGYDDPIYAPEFSLLGLDDYTYSLEGVHDCWVVINFWATWCAPCVEEMPVLQDVSEIFEGKLVLLGINQREQVEIIHPFVNELAITFPILINPPDAVLSQYGVVNLPQTVLIDPNGEIVWRQFGPIDLVNFTALLENFIAGRVDPQVAIN